MHELLQPVFWRSDYSETVCASLLIPHFHRIKWAVWAFQIILPWCILTFEKKIISFYINAFSCWTRKCWMQFWGQLWQQLQEFYLWSYWHESWCFLHQFFYILASVIIILDQRRIKEVRLYLTKLRLNPERVERPKKEVQVNIIIMLLVGCRDVVQDKVCGIVKRTWPLQEYLTGQSIWGCLKNPTFAGISHRTKYMGLFKEPNLCRDISQDKVSGIVKRTWAFSVQDSPKILPLDKSARKRNQNKDL